MNPPIWFFSASLAATLYIYLGYPALAAVIARLRPRPVLKAPVRPSVCVIIPAHNEAELIGRKIRNTLALDYPRDRLRILVVSDGSTDDTDEIVRRYEGPQVRLIVQSRQGKAFALNRGASAAESGVLVLTDANTILERDALRHLVENFADPEVGGVAGNKRYRLPGVGDGDGAARGESAYWRFDTWQKSCESRFGSVFAADGALYALRRSLYVPIRDPAQADDIAISARIVLQGYRLVFEPRAVVVEEAPADRLREFGRKVRVTNHSLRALLNLRGRLWTSGFYSVQLLSHKFLRHFSPVLLLALFVSTAVLARDHLYFQLVLAGQLAACGLGALGFAFAGRSGRSGRSGRFGRFGHSGLLGRLEWPRRLGRLMNLPAYFCMMNVAALLGILAVVRGRRLRMWTPRGDGVVAEGPAAQEGHTVLARTGRGGAHVLECILIALLLAPATGAAQPAAPAPELSFWLTLASIYDSNLDYVQNSEPAYGALAGAQMRFQSRADRPALLVEYAANIQSYLRTDRWDRVSQRGRVNLAGRLGPAWSLGLGGDFSLMGATEDRELVDDFRGGPRLEYRHGGASLQITGGQGVRWERDGGIDGTSEFAEVDLRGRLLGSHGWRAVYRIEEMDSEDPRRRNVRSTYRTQYSRRAFTRGWLGLGLQYRAQQYPERLVEVDGIEESRQDRGWQVQGTWVTNFRPGPELQLHVRYESRQSNVAWAEFDNRYVMIALRQPFTFTGGGSGPSRPMTGAPRLPPPPPVAEPPLHFTQTGLGDGRACALTGGGAAYCWPAERNVSEAAKAGSVSDRLRFSAIAVGPAYACALSREGSSYCWGDGTAYPSAPDSLRTPLRFESLTAGAERACGLTADGRAYCWGDNRSGAMGSSTPVPLAGDYRFKTIDAGSRHACGVTFEGAAYCWGDNSHGELGALFTSFSPSPVVVTGGLRFSAVSAGARHTCGVTPEGEVYCWGAGSWGQLGNGSSEDSRRPVRVGGGPAFTTVSAGVDHTCAIARDGSAHCWGRNDRDQLGSGSEAHVQAAPLRVNEPEPFESLHAFEGTCGLTVGGELRCWGTGGARADGL